MTPLNTNRHTGIHGTNKLLICDATTFSTQNHLDNDIQMAPTSSELMTDN